MKLEKIIVQFRLKDNFPTRISVVIRTRIGKKAFDFFYFSTA